MTKDAKRSLKTPTVSATTTPASKAATPKATPSKPAASTTVKKVAPIVPSATEVKGEKHKKQKLIRDSFTMPESDYAQIATLKARCLKAGISAKKSEVLRAALNCLAAHSDVELTKVLSGLAVIKTGRPAKA